MCSTELISFAWSSSLKIISAFWGLTIHKHSLSPSQSKLNTSEKSAWAPLGSRSWTGHMRATRVLLRRGCQAAVWLTHGPSRCKTAKPRHLHSKSDRDSCSNKFSAGSILPTSDFFCTFPLPGTRSSFETAMDWEFILRRTAACPESVTALWSAAEKTPENIHHHYDNYGCDCCSFSGKQQSFLTQESLINQQQIVFI